MRFFCGNFTNGVMGWCHLCVRWESVCVAVEARACACMHVMEFQSWCYLINIITRPINLPNGSGPLIAGVETSIFEAIKHTFWKLRACRRKMASRWTALSWQQSETRGRIQYYRSWWSGPITTQAAVWSAARGWGAEEEEMKVYEAPKKDFMDISMLMLPGTVKLLSVAKYLSLWRIPKKHALRTQVWHGFLFCSCAKNPERICE